MISLVFPAPKLRKLQQALAHERLESAAILLCVPVRLSEGWRLLVKEIHVAPEDAYGERTEVSARLHPAFGLPMEKKANQLNWSLVYCHTHPFQGGRPAFSSIDDKAEGPLAQYASFRSPNVPHLALLFGAEQVVARCLGAAEEVAVLEIGAVFDRAFDPGSEDVSIEETSDRQVRAFGLEGQRSIQRSRVGIVGLGGTGSLVVQQLAHLGAREFILVDHDTIEVTNLNRVVGVSPADAGCTAKTVVAERMIRHIQPDAQIRAFQKDVVDPGVGRSLAEADVIFCCTDSQASRHLLNQLSYQYLVPVIDLGVAIHAPEGQSVQIAGHVKMMAPGLPCLWCIRHLDSKQVREELMNRAHQAADPYFGTGRGVAQPAVISLNGTIASLAMTMYLAAVAGIPVPARHVIYDGNRSRVNAVHADSDPECNFCSPHSTAGYGDTYPLPERRDG